jgi:SAM-dependent methyltransferase
MRWPIVAPMTSVLQTSLSPLPPQLPHSSSAPSEWITRFAHLLPPQAQVLDIACGSGRHAAYLAQCGHRVTGVDRNTEALALLPASVKAVTADIENSPWPLPGQQFDAVIVTHYLWRALWPQILASVRAGGVLLYETFGQGNERYGKPSRPDFLLAPGELLQVCAGWHVVAYEHGVRSQPDRVVQRIAAICPGGEHTPRALP